jgi:hypothetical protein
MEHRAADRREPEGTNLPAVGCSTLNPPHSREPRSLHHSAPNDTKISTHRSAHSSGVIGRLSLSHNARPDMRPVSAPAGAAGRYPLGCSTGTRRVDRLSRARGEWRITVACQGPLDAAGTAGEPAAPVSLQRQPTALVGSAVRHDGRPDVSLPVPRYRDPGIRIGHWSHMAARTRWRACETRHRRRPAIDRRRPASGHRN